MTQPIISVENLSKRYRLGQSTELGKSFREMLTDLVKRPLSTAGNKQADDSFWALKDVSFELNAGDALGIIGRNGAGKSTLLKILSRVVEPTSGVVRLRGRVASLLEVGTGFHPELTGRENIYLNGAILGMKRAELDRKFDEIVDFSGVEKFLDTPVKRYSSGMYVRLAFAVAAHLEPEILIVDEVLAVGDAAFQKKCLGKMEEASKNSGRTVLFVSHNMLAIKTLCRKAVLLEGGSVALIGNSNEVVEKYLDSGVGSNRSQVHWPLTEAPGTEKARITKINVSGERQSESGRASLDESLLLTVEFAVLEPGPFLHIAVHVKNNDDVVVFETGSGKEKNWSGKPHSPGNFASYCRIPANLLNDGTYHFTVLLLEDEIRLLTKVERAVSIEMIEDGSDRDSWLGKWSGTVRPQLDWETQKLTDLAEPEAPAVSYGSDHKTTEIKVLEK